MAVVVGLLRQKKVHFMFAAREELTAFIRSFMKEVLHSPTQPNIIMYALTDAVQLFTRQTSHIQWKLAKVCLKELCVVILALQPY